MKADILKGTADPNTYPAAGVGLGNVDLVG